MTGEMVTVVREEWPIHAAIAEAVGGELKPFDVYQGPYIVVGKDVRVGKPPYQLAPKGLGVVRLWVGFDYVYREDTDEIEPVLPGSIEMAVFAAKDLLGMFEEEPAA